MQQVLLALLPGMLAMTYYFGWGVVINVVLAVGFALTSEALMLWLRKQPLKMFLTDNSAVVTAVLFALALPPLSPWWLIAVGVGFAIIVAKHLYGGLGHNPFNPAMAGYVVLLVAFPKDMVQWLPPSVSTESGFNPLDTLVIKLTGHLPVGMSWDAVTAATPLDLVKTQLGLNKTISEITTNPLFGDFSGRGWEWVANWYFIGGVWLIYKRTISWHIPVSVLLSLGAIATLYYLVDQDLYPSPAYHIFSGAAVIGAFFIATDPVSSSTTPVGRILYGTGIGVLTYVIRTWGGYPDGLAFAVLLMNMAVPLIDRYTQPRVFGHRTE